MKKTLFLVLSCCIVVFSIISICTAPIINGVLKEASSQSWKTLNCKYAADTYEANKSDDNKKNKNKCYRQKAMYGLEYSSLILDIVLGFVCAVLGLLHYFDVGKPFEKITGIIGLSAGVITFILTLVYICYSGYIFTKQSPTVNYDVDATKYKLGKDGAFAEKDGSQYKCLYYKSDNKDSIYAKFSDLGKKQYNYQKKRYFDTPTEISGCIASTSEAYTCSNGEYATISSSISSSCEKLFLPAAQGFGNKYLFDMWITTIIFTVLICVCAIGLAIFGFLLFKNSDGSGL